MPIKRPQLVNGEIYHIIIRAIEGLGLFKDKRDYIRMICNLVEFNDEDPVSTSYRDRLNKFFPKLSKEIPSRTVLSGVIDGY